MEENKEMENKQPSIWVRQARRRADTRTFVVPVDAKGRAILSFWVSQSPRPVIEDVNCIVE